MKFTIATIHNAYGVSNTPDGKAVESELNSLSTAISLADVNWLQPVDDHKYIADILFEDEIFKLDRVERALKSYFTEQFEENTSRLLWMPSFHKMHLFCKHYLNNKSVFDVNNTIFSRVLNEVATEVEVLVFSLGEESLSKLGAPKIGKESFVVNGLKVQVSAHEITENSPIFEGLLNHYSLTMLNREGVLNFDGATINDPIMLEQFSNYGKLKSL